MGRFTQAVGAVALAGAFTVSGAVVASASPAGTDAYSDCKSGQWCMWDGDGGTGTGYVAYNSPSAEDLSIPYHGFNDRANSIWNRTSRAICVYWDKDFGGGSIRYNAGVQATLPVSWKNKVSSYRTIPNGVTSCNYE